MELCNVRDSISSIKRLAVGVGLQLPERLKTGDLQKLETIGKIWNMGEDTA